MAREIAAGLTDARLLAWLFMACGMGLVASLPNAVRAARALDIDQPLAGAVSAHLFGYLFVAPLLVYGVAALAHLVGRAFGATGGYFGARAAVIWSLLLAGPLALAVTFARLLGEAAFDGAPTIGRLLGYAAMAYWLWLFAASFAEAEGFPATGRVALVLGLLFAGLSVSVSLLLRGAPVTG
nr:YIP1 family protein [uncultured Amaricoccus sp.]